MVGGIARSQWRCDSRLRSNCGHAALLSTCNHSWIVEIQRLVGNEQSTERTLMDTQDRPNKRGYARIERERRFLVEAFPQFVDATAYERLVDRYIEGTELRLRRIESPDGALVQVKLGQKRANPDDPDNLRHQEMTTFYLRPEDSAVLAALPARVSVKRRYAISEQGRTFALDVYEQPGSRRGLMVVEVECDADEDLDRMRCPSWAVREITEDSNYSGANISTSEC